MTRKTKEARIEQLRREPAFRELVRILKRQTEEQLDRLTEYGEHSEREDQSCERPEKDHEETREQ